MTRESAIYMALRPSKRDSGIKIVSSLSFDYSKWLQSLEATLAKIIEPLPKKNDRIGLRSYK
jgi:hypothetical protein